MKSQFNNLGKQIFMDRDPVTQQEMEAYLSGKLSQSEMHDIELRMEANEMSAEAMEGFEAHPEAMAGLAEVQNKFRSNLAKKKSWTTTHTMVAAGIAAIAMMGVAYGLMTPDSTKELAESNTNETVVRNKADIVHIDINEPIEITEEIELEVDAANVLPQAQQITAQHIEYHQPVTVTAPDDVSDVQLDSIVQQLIDLEPLEPLLVEMPDAVEPAKVVKSNIDVLMLNNFLVVDYSKIRNQGIVQPKPLEVDHGTPVWMENKDDQVDDIHKSPALVNDTIDYIDFLRETQGKLDKNRYKSALKDYHKILKQFPSDVNALFYGGLCYYNLDKPERAVQYFKKVTESSVNTFHQDGKFYMALSLRLMGKYGQGNGILHEIVKEGGFYADQAKALIDQ